MEPAGPRETRPDESGLRLLRRCRYSRSMAVSRRVHGLYTENQFQSILVLPGRADGFARPSYWQNAEWDSGTGEAPLVVAVHLLRKSHRHLADRLDRMHQFDLVRLDDDRRCDRAGDDDIARAQTLAK